MSGFVMPDPTAPPPEYSATQQGYPPPPYQQNFPPYLPTNPNGPYPPTDGYPPQISAAPYPPAQGGYPPQPPSFPGYSQQNNVQVGYHPQPCYSLTQQPGYLPHQQTSYPPQQQQGYLPQQQQTCYPPQQQPGYPPQPQNGYPYSPAGATPGQSPYQPPQYPSQDPTFNQYPQNLETSQSSGSKGGLVAGATAVAGAAGAAGAAFASGIKGLSGDKKHKSHLYDENYQNQGYPPQQGDGSHKHGNKRLHDATHFGQEVLQSGLLGRKAQIAGAVVGLAKGDSSNNSGGIIGTAAATGLMGNNGRMAAHVMGMGLPKDHGGMSTQSVLGSGLLGSKGIVAGAAIDLVKGRRHN